MASIVFGSARGQSVLGGEARAGDQAQITTPDFKGEVSMQDFYISSKGWWIIRPKDSHIADRIAQLMKDACNNRNLGYSQAHRDGVITHGIHTNTPTWCDCSSLVRACVKEGTGIDSGTFATESEVSVLGRTNLFLPAIGFVSLAQTPVYAGDILVTKTKGHTGIIVSSTYIRTGSTLSPEFASMVPLETGEFPMFTEYVDYIPRTEAPKLEPKPKPRKDKEGKIIGYTEDTRDLFYVNEDDGGYNIFDELNNEAYIWGRFSEVMDQPCNFGKGALGSLYNHNEDGYQRNVAATLGSVMCFSKPGTRGWAGIVEAIDPQGSVSLSFYNDQNMFDTKILTKRYGIWDFDDFKFQGFVHNPAVPQIGVVESAKETFIRIAEEQVGSDASWTFRHTDLTDNNSWSAAFVTACSAVAGSSLNIVIPNVVSCSAIGRVGVLRNMGTWYRGPIYGQYTSPHPGDIVLFRKVRSTDRMSRYDADHAGIVSDTNGGQFTVIEGDCSDKVKKNQYSISNKQISGYFRPNWDLIDGTSDSVNQYRDIQGLYTNGVSINDAAVREIGYLNNNLKPSIHQSNIKLSVVNYTGLLGNMYSVFAQSAVSTAAKSELVVDLWTNTIKSYYQTDGVGFESIAPGLLPMFSENSETDSNVPTITVDVDANIRSAYNHLVAQGISSAAACGILGNIKAESNFNTAAQGDKMENSSGNKVYTSFGICQWHNNRKSDFKEGRGTNMKNFCGPNWYTNLTGQLDFLLQELKSYSPTLTAIRTCANTQAGARHVADVFVRDFERPAQPDSESIKRQGYAAGFWDKLVN